MPIERTFRLTRDDITEIKLDAIGAFVEWLQREKGWTLGVPVGALDEFFGFDTYAFGSRRITSEKAAGLPDSWWSQQRYFDSSVTAEPLDDMPPSATNFATVES